MFVYEFEVIGTRFKLTFWDNGDQIKLKNLAQTCEEYSREFDGLYSRFKSDSLISRLAGIRGKIEVPKELIEMLELYNSLYKATGGKINPSIGFALEDLGYDKDYSLQSKKELRPVQPLDKVVTIEDRTHITLHDQVLFDLGALGKGFLIDCLFEIIQKAGIQRFLIDGSGDIRYFSVEKENIVCGLEDPQDESQVIGTITLQEGSLCASATNRRAWRTHNHYLDPETQTSPDFIIATWVIAKNAKLADGLSSALFFVEPEKLHSFEFEYLILNKHMQIKKSDGFTADLFT